MIRCKEGRGRALMERIVSREKESIQGEGEVRTVHPFSSSCLTPSMNVSRS